MTQFDLLTRVRDGELDQLRAKLVGLASELLLRNGAFGVIVGDVRFAAETRGWLTGDESEAFMNALDFGAIMRTAGGFRSGSHRRSRAKSAKRSLNAVYTTREHVPCDAGAA